MKRTLLSIAVLSLIIDLALHCSVGQCDFSNSEPSVKPVVTQKEKAEGLSKEGKTAGDRIVVTVKGVDFAFRWCPPGTFMMGSPESEEERNDNETQHQVSLTKGFWMMEREVIQKQWKAIMDNNPSHLRGSYLPVEGVTWKDVQFFCDKCVQLGFNVKLPTEAQWEYACRAGSSADHSQNNSWGLQNMHEEVWEFCSDWYGPYPNESVTDPTGPSVGDVHICRGGSNGLFMMPNRERSAQRHFINDNIQFGGRGFRCIIEAKAMDDLLRDIESGKNKSVSLNNCGKLFVLSIWGTNANKDLIILQKAFDKKMSLSGLNLDSKNDPDNFVADYKTLTGNDASKQNILKACRSINQQAQKNDVIFVYICCKGAMKQLHENDNRCYHVLFPEIKTAKQTENINDYGLLRSEIIGALTQQDHRLVVLITDADTTQEIRVIENDENSSGNIPEESKDVSIDDSYYFFSPSSTDSRLRVFLKTNVGLVDYNSNSPYEGQWGMGGENVFTKNTQGLPNSPFFNAFMTSFILTNETQIPKSTFLNDLELNLSENANLGIPNSNRSSEDPISQRLFDFKGRGYININGADGER